jgi:hypothetical protein
MDTRQRTRRLHARKPVSWTAWVKTGTQRLRCHTVDLSANGARLKPRGEMQPGTPVQLQLQPPDGHAVDVDAVVWRVDHDSVAVMFLKNIPVHFAAASKLAENGRRGWR